MVAVQTKCASQHITVSVAHGQHTLPSIEAEADALHAPDFPSQQQQQQQQGSGSGVQLHVTIECLVISVWDDERRRLLGCHGQGSRAAELCCIYWDQLSLCLTRDPSAGQVLQPNILIYSQRERHSIAIMVSTVLKTVCIFLCCLSLLLHFKLDGSMNHNHSVCHAVRALAFFTTLDLY